jgi:hypothetical protein
VSSAVWFCIPPIGSYAAASGRARASGGGSNTEHSRSTVPATAGRAERDPWDAGAGADVA